MVIFKMRNRSVFIIFVYQERLADMQVESAVNYFVEKVGGEGCL